MSCLFYYDSPIGRIGIVDTEGAVSALFTGNTGPAQTEVRETPLLLEASRQLFEYFSGRRRVFNLPLSPSGTGFQHKVWKALRDIPYGETRSYRDIAEAVDSPLACRAVGGANHANPIMIVIPCHRVIAADKTLGGYGGGLDMKKTLLRLEGAL